MSMWQCSIPRVQNAWTDVCPYPIPCERVTSDYQSQHTLMCSQSQHFWPSTTVAPHTLWTLTQCDVMFRVRLTWTYQALILHILLFWLFDSVCFPFTFLDLAFVLMIADPLTFRLTLITLSHILDLSADLFNKTINLQLHLSPNWFMTGALQNLFLSCIISKCQPLSSA